MLFIIKARSLNYRRNIYRITIEVSNITFFVRRGKMTHLKFLFGKEHVNNNLQIILKSFQILTRKKEDLNVGWCGC